jgi:glycosyltransferase involved in cell wall biosynthesis
MNVLLSVIICTYNRYQILGDAIASIEVQDCPADEFELIIVDNSTDLPGQRNFMDGLDISCNHKYIVEAIPGLSRARNIGVANATGGVVAFMDDDARPVGHWVSQLIADFADNPAIGIAGGPVRPIWPNARPPWLHPWLEGYLTILDRGPKRRMLERHEWLAGTNIAFRRDVLARAGHFSENLGRIGKLLLSNEELQVTNAIRDLGYDVLYDPAAEMHHRVHEDRINPAWVRRRIFWQVVSDVFADGGNKNLDFEDGLSRIFGYLATLPPKDRGISGLFLDTDNPESFHVQTEALSTLIHLLATDGRDWRAFLELKTT